MSLFHRTPPITRVADLAVGMHARVVGTVVATSKLLITAHGDIACVAYATYIDEPIGGLGFRSPSTTLTSRFEVDDGSGTIAVAEDAHAKIEIEAVDVEERPGARAFGEGILERETANYDATGIRMSSEVPHRVAAVHPGDRIAVIGTIALGADGLYITAVMPAIRCATNTATDAAAVTHSHVTSGCHASGVGTTEYGL